MIIYTDSIGNGIQGGEMTPAHVYAATRDFSTILDEIARDNLPTNTGRPFPVNWKNEDDNTPPWINKPPYNQQPMFYNPY